MRTFGGGGFVSVCCARATADIASSATPADAAAHDRVTWILMDRLLSSPTTHRAHWIGPTTMRARCVSIPSPPNMAVVAFATEG